MKKIIVTLLFVCIFSPVFASNKFTAQENDNIDSQIKQSVQSGTYKDDLAKLQKQINTLTEISLGIKQLTTSGSLGYAIAKYPTPVLYYPIGKPSLHKSFGADPYTGLNLDSAQQIDEMVFVTFTGTVFSLLDKVQTGGYTYYQIRTREFGVPNSGIGYYVDSRFVEVQKDKPKERKVRLPSLASIYSRLLSASGTIYVWGGTDPNGVTQLEEFYPSTRQKTDLDKTKKIVKGVDCSGLLYRATNGYTPRTTSELITYGTGLAIKGLTAEQIIEKIKPLDLITWAGHVMIVLNKDFVIESRWFADNPGGTKVRPLKEVLLETMEKRNAANEYSDPMTDGKKNFVIRHWFTGK